MKLSAKRKEIAKSTIDIIEQGYYLYRDRKINIAEVQQHAEDHCVLITPDKAQKVLEIYQAKVQANQANQVNQVAV